MQPSTPPVTGAGVRTVTLPAHSPLTQTVVTALHNLLELVPPHTMRQHIEEPLLQLLATNAEVASVATIAESYLLLFRFLQTAEAEMLKSKYGIV
jgi:hypothetical protein